MKLTRTAIRSRTERTVGPAIQREDLVDRAFPILIDTHLVGRRMARFPYFESRRPSSGR
jgi:hypothetical protein